MYQVYKILSDDTFSSIADRFSIDVSELERINGSSSFNVGDMIVVPNNSMYVTYVVKKGDSLYSIAKSFDQDVNVLYNINGIKEGDFIYPGEELLIPRRDVFTYVTSDGDTINSVSLKSGISVSKLISDNDFILEPGQLIIYKA
jgi:LysM repeat protein